MSSTKYIVTGGGTASGRDGGLQFDLERLSKLERKLVLLIVFLLMVVLESSTFSLVGNPQSKAAAFDSSFKQEPDC